jgi:hypothetical protein
VYLFAQQVPVIFVRMKRTGFGHRLRMACVVALLGTAALVIPSCSNELDALADPKELYSVYCVLDGNSREQYLRLARVYLTEGDAVQYAATTDLSVPEATVRLVSGTDTLRFFAVDTVQQPGDFLPGYTVFRSTDTVRANRTYVLDIRLPNREGFRITGHTTVPDTPLVTFPAEWGPPGPGNLRARPEVNFADEAEWEWRGSNASLAEQGTNVVNGTAYEFRIRLDYSIKTPPDIFTPYTYVFGPVRNITDGGALDGQTQSNRIRYRMPDRAFLNDANNRLQAGDREYDHRDSTTALFAIFSAIDTFFYNYMRVNNPAFDDLNAIRPNYTNIRIRQENGDEYSALGILGSTNSGLRYFRFNQCSMFLLGINNVPRPINPPCE